MSKIGYEDNILFIQDVKTSNTAEVYLRDCPLRCNVCEEKNCVHVHYVLAAGNGQAVPAQGFQN